MAKGQVTESDLESGLKSLGGLRGLAAAPTGARRDSPFGSDFAKRTARNGAGSQPVGDGNAALELGPEGEGAEQPKAAAAPAGTPVVAPPPAASSSEDLAKRRTPRRQRKGETKVDLFPERVTVLMSPEMRDRVNLLAAKLQRKKTDKVERITANTVLRVAVSALLSSFKLEEGDAPNTEDELLELVQRKIRGSQGLR